MLRKMFQNGGEKFAIRLFNLKVGGEIEETKGERKMKKIFSIFLVVGLLSMGGCAGLRGIGLSDAGKDEIKDILVSEVVIKMIDSYCSRPADRRQAVVDRLRGLGVNLSMIAC